MSGSRSTHDSALPVADLAALFAKRPQVIKPGLDRVERALAVLAAREGGHLERAVPSIMVAGTNGKGTTSGFLFQLMAAAGVRAGLFTSPHLVRFAERIQVAGVDIQDEELLGDLHDLRVGLGTELYDDLSFFEVNALLAWRAFRRHGASFDVLEVGLGGRWDATNAADPCCSIIVSIGLDHVSMLGSTLGAIAAEKAGVMRAGRPVFVGDDAGLPQEAMSVIVAKAEALGCPLWRLGCEILALPEHVHICLPASAESAAVDLELAWPQGAQSWPGYKRRNFALAAAAFAWLVQKPEVRAACAPAVRSLATSSLLAHAVAQLSQGAVVTPASLTGRFHQLELAPPSAAPRMCLLDVGHNVEGICAFTAGLVETGLATPERPLPGLVSILADKPFDAMLDLLRSLLHPLVLFPVHGERSWSAEQLAPRHRDLAWGADFTQAWQILAHLANGPLVICGSVHAIGEVLQICGRDGTGRKINGVGAGDAAI